MARSYVGIISPRGLESLLPETEHAVPFLVRRAYGRRPGEALCYWAVMPDSTARGVELQLQAHFHEDAFYRLRGEAAHFGTILPFGVDDVE